MLVSPIVGTFYRAVEPGATPYVEVGDLVEPGQVIGIVEAMKLMNHITAEHAGRVAEVLRRRRRSGRVPTAADRAGSA